MPESINEQKEWKGSDFLLTNVSKMTFFFTSVTQKPSSHLVTVAQVLMKSNFVSVQDTHSHHPGRACFQGFQARQQGAGTARPPLPRPQIS